MIDFLFQVSPRFIEFLQVVSFVYLVFITYMTCYVCFKKVTVRPLCILLNCVCSYSMTLEESGLKDVANHNLYVLFKGA